MEKKESVATIGMFDGVHRGHQFVLQQVVATARQNGLQSMAVTFDHTLRPDPVLTPLQEKLALMKQSGIDRVEVLPFTDELKQMTARQFMQDVLKERLQVSILLTGYDNRFGHNREEGFDDYVRYGREMGIEVRQLPAEGMVSSSRIRQLLQQGAVSEAADCLGHHYSISGRVVHGEHIGTQLGFPTANIEPHDPRQLIPAAGAYAVRCGQAKGMMNIGTRPTFGEHTQTLEVHLFDYAGDLYGQRLTIQFIGRLRGEQHFNSPDELVEQLKRDTIQAKQLL